MRMGLGCGSVTFQFGPEVDVASFQKRMRTEAGCDGWNVNFELTD